jgi:cytochrome b6-f complex iron-sulfur subunit
VNRWTVVGIVVGATVVVIAAVIITIGAARSRRDGQEGPARDGHADGDPGRNDVAVSRRQLLHRGIIGLFAAALSGVVASFLTFIWPTVTGEVGSTFLIGGVGDLRRRLASDRRPYVGGSGHFYLVPFPASRIDEARAVYPAAVVEGMASGFVALSPVCTHQGCQVPYCSSSGWFECPCHGSRYDAIGEQRRGPAPRGLDHYAVTVNGGVVRVDTSRKYLGLPPGTETDDDPARGPHCYK